MSGVVAPLIDYIENFCADNAAQHRENAEIPSLVAVIAQPLGVAYADPKSEQDAQRDQKSVRRQRKTPDMKKLWEHSFIGCAEAAICYLISLTRKRLVSSGESWYSPFERGAFYSPMPTTPIIRP